MIIKHKNAIKPSTSPLDSLYEEDHLYNTNNIKHLYNISKHYARRTVYEGRGNQDSEYNNN